MGISAGIRALQLANVACPDAIITGTALGSMSDTEHFLKDMIHLNEEALNPTFFIQSTYNSINGWIALQSKSTGYNQTYVHRGLSFEWSLQDAMMLLNEQERKKVALVGCFDELTDEYFSIKNKVHYWKSDPPESLDLMSYSHTRGTIAGEGTAFFTLCNDAGSAVCVFRGLKMIERPHLSNLRELLRAFLLSHHMSDDDIDVVITGMSGDSLFQPIYDALLTDFDRATITSFKHLTGEYPTASGFALWLATRIFITQSIPENIIQKKRQRSAVRHILIINHYILNTVSFMLLSQRL